MTMAFDLNTRVLFVDDSWTMHRIMAKLFEKIGIQNYESASSAQSALKELERQSFGLIICDYQMPFTNGYDFFRQLRVHPLHRRVPFLLTTTQEAEAALTAEARDMLRATAVKPFSAETLLQKIEQVVDPTSAPVLDATRWDPRAAGVRRAI
jgi:CheY-like chemotaxis protein